MTWFLAVFYVSCARYGGAHMIHMKRHTTWPHQRYRHDTAPPLGQKYNEPPWASGEEKTALKNQWYDVVYNEIP